jgi:hypothetical protein
LSGDAVTYVTQQGIVYIFDKESGKIKEYEGSTENIKLRDVELTKDGRIKINGEELTSESFEKLYPITNKITRKHGFYGDLVASSTKVLRLIQSQYGSNSNQ